MEMPNWVVQMDDLSVLVKVTDHASSRLGSVGSVDESLGSSKEPVSQVSQAGLELGYRDLHSDHGRPANNHV